MIEIYDFTTKKIIELIAKKKIFRNIILLIKREYKSRAQKNKKKKTLGESEKYIL